MYAAGPRVSEVATLKASDIDSGRGLIWIRGGKGRKDRQALLPPKLLELLRVYFRWKRPKEWLFPGGKPDQPITTDSIFIACRKAAQKANISKAVHPQVAYDHQSVGTSGSARHRPGGQGVST
jgi:integrase